MRSQAWVCALDRQGIDGRSSLPGLSASGKAHPEPVSSVSLISDWKSLTQSQETPT